MKDKDCLFCKIIAGEIPSKKIYEDENVYAFADIHPQAPTHVLICPKRHIDRIADLEAGDETLMGQAVLAAGAIAKLLKLTHYRLVINNGEEVGQSVFHIHFHLMGGRKMTWPPG